ncbi:MAG TPA: ABC-F family ATP-binding cassette domain-containing protein [Propionibacteriaceae bacterium]|nr:ABC-F family ATP-binding cassette domain-containing protein [Propionibacteriaceae bacterium]
MSHLSGAERPAITVTDLVFAWPDGTPVLGGPESGFSLSVPPGRSGIVGTNGSGKSTLLSLIAGRRAPQRGAVSVPGRVAYLPQDLTLDVAQPVDAFLGIADTRAALGALERGEEDPGRVETLLEVIGTDWDVEARTVAQLGRLGLGPDVLDRRLGELSGGEVTRLGITRLLLLRPDVMLLDEPTNNLDGPARQHLYDVVASYSGVLLVVSHDRDLLDRMDRIGELRDGSVRWYGGGYSAYAERVAAEQATAEQALVAAKADVRRQQADRQEAERLIAQRRRQGARNAVSSNMGKGAQHFWANRSEKHAASYRATHQQRLDEARQSVVDAEANLRDDPAIRIDLPATQVPAGREVLTTQDLVLRTGRRVELWLRGPELVAITGRNGSGKTTLLRTVVGELSPAAGTSRLLVPAALLPQRLTLLDPARSVVENVAARAPASPVGEIRAQLARFLFRGRTADRSVGLLSGGELFRATLAALLLADPAPQLLLLDEPTNNLDFASYEALVTAVRSYEGAVLVVSHDRRFLEEIGVTRVVDLDAPAQPLALGWAPRQGGEA